MAFLRASLAVDTTYDVRGAGLVMRPPAMSDYESWAALRAMSRDHLTHYEPQWASDELSRSGGDVLRVDTGDRRLRSAFDGAAAAERASLATSFASLGVRHLRLSTDGPWLPALAQGFTRTPDRTGRTA